MAHPFGSCQVVWSVNRYLAEKLSDFDFKNVFIDNKIDYIINNEDNIDK